MTIVISHGLRVNLFHTDAHSYMHGNLHGSQCTCSLKNNQNICLYFLNFNLLEI